MAESEKTMKTAASVLAACVVATVSISVWANWKPEYSFKLRYQIDCRGSDNMLMPYLRMTSDHLDAYMKTLPVRDGVVAVDYKHRGIHINPFTVAMHAMYQLDLYCQDGRVDRLADIEHYRNWLMRNMTARTTSGGTRFYVITYNFPNEPFVSKPGWISSLSQSAWLSLLMRFSPRFDPFNEDMILHFARAFTIPVKEGGIYNPFTNNTIVWEEVATTEHDSHVINGHAIATYILAHEVWRLKGTPEYDKLIPMIEQAKRAFIQIIPVLVPEAGRIRYDLFRPVTLDGEHYSHKVIDDFMVWLNEIGEVPASEVERIKELRPL